MKLSEAQRQFLLAMYYSQYPDVQSGLAFNVSSAGLSAGLPEKQTQSVLGELVDLGLISGGGSIASPTDEGIVAARIAEAEVVGEAHIEVLKKLYELAGRDANRPVDLTSFMPLGLAVAFAKYFDKTRMTTYLSKDPPIVILRPKAQKLVSGGSRAKTDKAAKRPSASGLTIIIRGNNNAPIQQGQRDLKQQIQSPSSASDL
jgi:aryl-alcohol dehydrogenase-like predicted oxidoreductase